MILRRVMEHVRDQNWTAVTLDFFIVVLGVFVGLQVNNWNEARSNRAIAERHLSEVAEDLQAHLDIHHQLYGSAVARIAAVDLVYERAFGETLPDTLVFSTVSYKTPLIPEVPETAYDNIMGWINLVRISVSSRNGYESLTASGHMSLIDNLALARDMQAYYGRYDDLLNTQMLFRQFRNDGVRDMYQFGVSPFDERPLDEVVAIARENPAFAAYLRATREWAILHANLLEDLRGETVTLLAEIRAEIGEDSFDDPFAEDREREVTETPK